VNCGRRAEKVFIDPKDYRTFVDLLKETADTPPFFYCKAMNSLINCFELVKALGDNDG
jgi:hypothetical protein